MEYTTEKFSRDIVAAEYIDGFRDAGRFLELCKACPNYGKSWGCPPFGFDTDALLRRYDRVRLFATKIVPDQAGLPLECAQELVRPERVRIEREQLEMERRCGGLSLAYVGKCLYCPDGDCTRLCGMPCRHPDKVRPSLEAFGFDIGKTLAELFGIELKWGTDGLLPSYLVLVSGVFYNAGTLTD